MLEHITESTESIWNKRVTKRMEELKLSQRAFIKRYREKFHTGSQSDVSKWTHIGEKDSKTGNPRKFPEFETMKKIAEVLGVSIGYLIGETDYETFELERASEYTGLSQESIKGIRKITHGKTREYRKFNPHIANALEILLNTPYLVEYLANMCEVAEAINDERHATGYFESVKKEIPENIMDDVWHLWYDPEDAIENLEIEATEEKWDYVKKVDDAMDHDRVQSQSIDLNLKASKYALSETHIKMIDDIMSSEEMNYMVFSKISEYFSNVKLRSLK